MIRPLLLSISLLFSITNGLRAQSPFHIQEGPLDIIPCDSPCVMLHANFIKPLKTNNYQISSIAYAPQSVTGTSLSLNDDQFTTAIPIGFNFCFFENVYTQLYLSDNGVLTFNPSYNGGSCNNNTQQSLPYFNSTFPDNAIFFLFMDVDPGLGGTVNYATIGTAPNRKLVIRYQNMKIFGATCSNTTSSYQVILYESTNIIEVHVAGKTTCDSNPLNYSNYATVGIQNAGATQAFTAPGKHAAVFTMTNEAIRIAPNGIPNYLLTWKDANNSTLATNVDSLYYCPGVFPYHKIRASIQYYCPTILYRDSVIIDKIAPHLDSLSIVKPHCNNDSSGSIQVFASSGNPPLTYSLNNGAYGSSNQFIHLPVGNYIVSIKDANGCKKDTLIFLGPQYNVFAYIDSVIKPTCPDSNGSIFIHAGNGVPPYHIQWSTGDTTWSVSGLPAGTYVATVSDANGCTNFAIVNLLNSNLPVVVSQFDKPQCHDTSGAIYLTISGGATPYHIQWSTGDTTSTINQLSSGMYVVTVTDLIGCSTTSIIFLDDTLNLVSHDTVLHNTTCNLANGSALVNAGLGLPPFTYLWMPGGQNTAIATGLAAGSYTCTTTDANNCITHDTVTIAPSVGMVNLVSHANANCDSTNGKIYLNGVQNNTGWVHTLWSTGDTSQVISGLGAGTYWVTTTDSIGCVKTDTIILFNDGKPHLGILAYTPPLCFGDSSGSVTLSGYSGTAPYKYSLDGITYTSFAQINHITGGTYTIYITDANSCPADTVVVFPQPAQLITQYTADTVVCFNDHTSTLSWQTSGGFAPYLYSFNQQPFTAQQIYTALTQGNYPLIIKDNNNCLDTMNLVVPGPSSALAAIADIHDIPCFETNTGSLSITLQGGWPPYTYSWSNGLSGLSFTNIGETHGLFTLHDAKDCVVETPIDVDQLYCCKAVVPNAFSPNNDGRNDVLRVMPISEVEWIKFSIFDRWGKCIFSTKNITESWDGSYLGNPCELDVYFYYLEYHCPFQKEKVIQKGDITLLR